MNHRTESAEPVRRRFIVTHRGTRSRAAVLPAGLQLKRPSAGPGGTFEDASPLKVAEPTRRERVVELRPCLYKFAGSQFHSPATILFFTSIFSLPVIIFHRLIFFLLSCSFSFFSSTFLCYPYPNLFRQMFFGRPPRSALFAPRRERGVTMQHCNLKRFL